MTTTRDVVRSGAFAPLQVQTYGQIPNVLDLPNLIKIQLDSFEWFKREGLRELLDEISPIQDFTGSKMDLIFGDYEFGEPKATHERVPRARHDVRRSALRRRRAAHQGNRRDQGAGALHRRLPADDGQRHVHHQRRRARRCLAARALAGRVLHDRDGPDHGPPPLLRQAHPEPRRLAGVRDLEPRRPLREGRPQAQDPGDDAPPRDRCARPAARRQG